MIDFDIAKTWHKIFAEQILFAAMGLITETPSAQSVCDDTACKLGKWLQGTGKGMEDLPSYVALVDTHRRFHGIACQFMAAIQGNQDAAMLDRIEHEFKAVSSDVLMAIDRLSVEMGSTHPDHAFPSQFVQPAPSNQIVWDDTLTIGIEAIDEHHKAILRIIGKLTSSPEAALRSELVVDCLTDLGKILDLHFSVEEAHMRQLGVPHDEFAAHCNSHMEILNQYADMNIAISQKKELKVKDVANQAIQWAIDHVVEYDLGLKKYLPAA